jgi:hypothetical protein
MLTIEDLSRENLIAAGGGDFEVITNGDALPVDFVSVEEYGYNLANSDNFSLWYTTLSVRVTLKSGAKTGKASGYIIGENQSFYSKSDRKDMSGLQGLAFYEIPTNMYGDAPDSWKQTVVDKWNETVQTGEVEETLDDTETSKEQEEEKQRKGEEFAEEKEQEDILSRTGKDGVVYDSISLKEIADAEYDARQKSLNTPIGPLDSNFEVVTVKEESFELTFDDFRIQRDIEAREAGKKYTGGGGTSWTLQITKETAGTRGDPWSTTLYNFYVNRDSAYEESFTKLTSLDEAEDMWNQYVAFRTEEFKQSYLDHEEKQWNERTEFDPVVQETSVYFVESPNSFESMLFSNNLDYMDRAFRKGLEGETRVGGGVFRGNFDDAVTFSNDGNTIFIEDFDTPRVTAQGISEDLSGGLAFTIKKGWRVTFALRTDSSLTFAALDESVDGIAPNASANEFEFVMYGGDRLEIDIDNEREGVHPFLITTKGREWSSIEEVDDELELTMVKAEELYFKDFDGSRTTTIETGETVDEGETTEGVVRFNQPPLSDRPGLNSRVMGAIEAEPEAKEAMEMSRDIIVQDVSPESSFIAPDDIVPDIDNPFDGMGKWIIGGIVFVAAVVLIGIYLNSRGRSSGSAA